MAEISHFNVTEHTRQSNTSATFADGLSLSSLVDGQTYLLLVRAIVGGNSSAQVFHFRVVHGSTAFTGSLAQFEPGSSSESVQYSYMTVFTQASSEDIKFQLASQNGTNAAYADDISIIALDISDLDYEFNENTTSATQTGSYVDRASVTFTPPRADEDWLLIGHWSILSNSITDNIFAKLVGGSDLTEVRREPEDTDEIHIGVALGIQNLPASSQTFKIQTRDGVGVNTYESSRIFALSLAQFETHTSASDVSQNPGQILTLNHTPDTTGDIVVLGYTSADAGGADSAQELTFNLQLNNSTIPAGNTVFNMPVNDSNDILPLYIQAIYAGTASVSGTLDLDGTESETDATFQDNTLVAFSTELAVLITEHDESGSSDLALTDEADYSGDWYRVVVDTLTLSQDSSGTANFNVNLTHTLSFSHIVGTESHVSETHQINLIDVFDVWVDWGLHGDLNLSHEVQGSAIKHFFDSLILSQEMSASKDVTGDFEDTLTLNHFLQNAEITTSEFELTQSIEYVLFPRLDTEDVLTLTQSIQAYNLTVRLVDELSLTQFVINTELKNFDLSSTLDLSQSVEIDFTVIQPFASTLQLSHDVQVYTLNQSVESTLELSQEIEINGIWNFALCCTLSLAQKAQRSWEESVSDTLVLTQDFGDPLYSNLYLTHLLVTNITLHSCSTDNYYIPDKHVKSNLSLSQEVTIIGDLNQAITQDIGIQATMAFLP